MEDLKKELEQSKLLLIISKIYPYRSTNQIMYAYFCILYNALDIEEKFQKETKLANKELLKHFDLPKVNTLDEIKSLFKNLYDLYSPIRNNVETLTNIEEIRIFENENNYLYRDVIKIYKINS